MYSVYGYVLCSVFLSSSPATHYSLCCLLLTLRSHLLKTAIKLMWTLVMTTN